MARLIAKVTQWKSPRNARFLCWDVHQLWDNGEVTVAHCVEDQEWGSSEESEAIAREGDYPTGFFRRGFHRLMNHAGTIHEEAL